MLTNIQAKKNLVGTSRDLERVKAYEVLAERVG